MGQIAARRARGYGHSGPLPPSCRNDRDDGPQLSPARGRQPRAPTPKGEREGHIYADQEMSSTGQRAGQFDRAELPANGAQALRAEPRTGVRQTVSARRYPIRGELGTRLCKMLDE